MAPADARRAGPRRLLGRLTATGATLALAAAGVVAMATPASADPLRDHSSGFEVGAAVGADHLQNDSTFNNLAATEFDTVTPENAMKWSQTEPSRGQFQFGNADQIANFAQQNNQTLRGHTLIWHSQLPSWVPNGNFGPSELETVMSEHIQGVAGNYAGQVDEWDVVNEPFNDDGSWRSTVFYDTLGEDYIAHALEQANQAAPNADLYLNDYNIEGINAKSDAMYQLAQDLLNQGVPLDGIGFEGHLILNQVPGDIQQNIQRFVDLGLEVRITELDIRMQTPASDQQLQQQADDYEQVFQACLNVSGCEGITVWGITDQYSWVPDTFDGEGAALMWDDNYNQKPAYDVVHELLGGTNDDPPDDPPPGGGGDCVVDYTVQNQWNSGFTASVEITNNGSAVQSWELGFEFTSGQSVTHGWNGSFSQSGSSVTVSNASWNGSVGSGQTVSFGFNGSHSGSNPDAQNFTFNGTSCTTS